MEEYREIKGFEDYQVSNYGNVRSLKRNIILKQGITKRYNIVVLYKDGKPHSKNIHRLVAEAFIPNPNNLPCVNHKDENLQNNKAENLEWCDYQYNNNYGTRTEKCIEKLSKPVVAVDSEGNVAYEFVSVMEAGRNGFNFGHVAACCRGLRRTHGGFRWYFKEDWLKIKNG